MQSPQGLFSAQTEKNFGCIMLPLKRPITATPTIHQPLVKRSQFQRYLANQSTCRLCGGMRTSHPILCRDSPSSSTKLSEEELEDTDSPPQNGKSHNGKTEYQNGKTENGKSENGKSENGEIPRSEIDPVNEEKDTTENGAQNGSENGQKNGKGRFPGTGQGLIERSEELPSDNGSSQNGSANGNVNMNGRSMNRNSGPKRPRGTLSPYGDIETAEGGNGEQLRNGKKGKEKGNKAKQLRGSLDIPENLRQVNFAIDFLPISVAFSISFSCSRDLRQIPLWSKSNRIALKTSFSVPLEFTELVGHF